MEKITLKNEFLRFIIEFCEYLLIILLIIDCNTVYRHILGKPIVPQIWNIIILLTNIIILMKHKKQDIKNQNKILLILLYNCLVMALIIIRQSDIILYTRLFLIFYPLAIIMCIQDINNNNKFNMIFKLENIILILAMSSLLFWLLGSLFNILKPNINVPVTWNNGDFYNGYFGICFKYIHQYELLPFFNVKIMRNIGIFTESPMYNIILIIGLFTELFLKEKCCIIKLSVISITILTTFGTIGIMLMLIGHSIKFIVNKKGKNIKIIFIAMFILIVLIGLLFINKKINASGSFSTHLDDYMAGIKAWKTSPIIGTGFNNYDIIHQFMNPARGNNLGTSNSLTDILAQGGIMMLVIYIAPFIILFKQSKMEINIFLWSLAPLFLFIMTIYHFTYLLFFILAFCLAVGWSLLES